MSWKLFWQIALLMVIGAMILSALKCGLIYGKHGRLGKCSAEHPRQTERKR
jgi:hypothetical protein